MRIAWEGKKVLPYLATGTEKTTDSCRKMPQDLKRRGMTDSVAWTAEGLPG